jgi:putative peptidoglycan lipid II flippase
MPEIIITTLFQHGVFGAGDSAATARVLSGYAIGIPAYVAIKVLSSASWARQDTATPVRVMAWGAGANIVLSLCFVLVIGVAGIALATALSGWLQFWLLRRRMARHGFATSDTRFQRVWPRCLGASAVMAAGLVACKLMIPDFNAGGLAFRIGMLSMLVIGGVLVYAVILLASGAIHMQDIRHYFTKTPNNSGAQ